MPPATCYDFPLLKDEVSAIVQDAVLSTLEGNAYDHAKVNDWINQMTTACVNDLRSLCPNFKYIVTCVIRQKKGASMDVCRHVHDRTSSAVAYWDERTDGGCTISWENSAMSVVLYVYGIAL